MSKHNLFLTSVSILTILAIVLLVKEVHQERTIREPYTDMEQFDEAFVQEQEDKAVYSAEKALYDYTIDFIKNHEGYVAEPYQCAANKWTIGYGHRTYGHESYKHLTEVEAEALLRTDFDVRLDIVMEKYPELSFHQQIALAHFAFCCGVGAMEKMYADTSIDDIDNWIHILGKPNSFLIMIRKFETDIYNNNPFGHDN
jgi:GH24 family phage-related lysozyme (muramidase)